jgi:hypothetical protein
MTMTTSRRAILAGAVSLPALATVPAFATPAPDPVFAAIEAHVAARALLGQPARPDGRAAVG